ncbi:putative Ig domain-containing protein [Rhizobium mayense]|uniref:putative Ig domain-containing protein n=1 Tax=Rhizobium mayense TaxID=1312184 RepID=UPI00398C7416
MIAAWAIPFRGKRASSSWFFQASFLQIATAILLSIIGVAVTSSPALALSAACDTLNANSGTTSYSQSFSASEFAAGESVTVSFTDNGGDPKTIPEINSGQIRLNNADSSTVFYSYSTYTGSPGPHSGSHGSLSTTGLSIQIVARTYISAVTIVCSGPVAIPTVTSISPSSGPVSGGTAVTITGTNLTGATAVSIGGSAASNVSVASASQITAISPSHSAGAVDVSVTTSGGTATLVEAFTYVAPSPPVANTVSIAVPYDSSATPIPLNLTGGTATSVAIAMAPGHGTAIASGTAITYTPAPGYVGSDSFTYTASNLDGTSAAATVSVTVNAPTLSIGPASLPAATIAASYDATVTASGGTAPYTYSVAAGSLPPGLNLNSSTGAITGTSTAAGVFNLTITATDSHGFSGLATYSLTVGSPTITLSPVTLSSGSIATAYNQTVAATGGTAPYTYTVTSGALPSGLTLNASSGAIVGTPTSGGSFNLTITATDSSTGNGAPFTASKAYTLPIGAPTIAITPASLPAATVATTYNQTITASGGMAPYTYAVTAGSLPAGLTLSPAGVLSGTPTADGTFNVTITATDSSAGAGPYTGSKAYSLAVGAQAPIAGNISVGVAANSSANPVTLALSGGAAASVAVVSPASHGATTASGTTITYTPTSGYSGSDSFTYTATNATGTSAPATVSVTISAPTLTFSPPGGTLPAGVVNVAYSQTVTASGGTSPYGYAVVGTLPAGLSLNHATGAITGTPTAAGNYSFSISATDANNATSSAAYTIAVAPPAATFTFSPSGGALPQAMAGEAYSQQITATGGVGTTIYSLASGTLPNGLILNISTGQLTGPLAAGTQGDYSFSIQARDSNGSTATVAFTLKVIQRAVSATDQVINVPEGSTPPDVYLNRGATGGPFTSADLAFVTPPNAGTVTIIQGQLAQAGPATAPVGWYLHYTPDPAYSGQVRVGFKLVSTLGTSNVGTITYNVRYDAAKVAEDIDGLVRGFVQSRQNMIANTIEVPGLLQRRQMQKATDPITALASPSEQGMKLGFSTSLAQMRAARGDNDAGSAPFNVWIGGAFLMHDDKSKRDSTSKWGSFGMVNMGVDYLLSEKALVGVSFHYDRMTDPTDQDAKLTGNGWLAGPYASLELGKGVFWNGSLRYGGSSNTINTQFWDGGFKTTRWMADTSIEGQWDLDEATTISPKLRAVYFSEKVDDYTVKNSSGDAITIDGFNEDQFRVSLGAEIARSFTMENGTKLTPKLGVTGGFSGLDGSGAFGAVTAGMSLETASFWMLDTSLLFNIEGDGQKSVGVKVAAAKKF